VWCSYPEINDVGLTAIRHPETGETGFSLRVGGGLSTDPHLAPRLDVFVHWNQTLAVLKAVAEIFRDSDVLREHREKARLKFLFLRHGWTADRFRSEIEARLGYRLEAAVPETPAEDAYRDHVGLHQQRQPGLAYAGFAILRGRLDPATMRATADLAERFGSGALRTTHMQNLVVLDVPRERTAAGEARDRRDGGQQGSAEASVSGLSVGAVELFRLTGFVQKQQHVMRDLRITGQRLSGRDEAILGQPRGQHKAPIRIGGPRRRGVHVGEGGRPGRASHHRRHRDHLTVAFPYHQVVREHACDRLRCVGGRERLVDCLGERERPALQQIRVTGTRCPERARRRVRPAHDAQLEGV
jgi:hypothetical protein